MIIKGFDHVSIIISDVEENLKFYRDILGFDVKMDFYDEGERARIIFLNMGNSMLELISPDDNPTFFEKRRWDDRKKGGVEHIAFLVEDVDKIYEYLKTKGIEFILGPLEFPDGKYGYFYGPEGVLLEIISWK
jgi:catechol 2,3-dioxygenase-like lactoylglutathione lyase family enzyme